MENTIDPMNVLRIFTQQSFPSWKKNSSFSKNRMVKISLKFLIKKMENIFPLSLKILRIQEAGALSPA